MENVALLTQVWGQGFGVMPSGVVENDHHSAVLAPVAQQPLQETLEVGRVERVGRHSRQPPIGHTHRPKDGDLLARRGMKHHGIDVFRGDPHDAP